MKITLGRHPEVGQALAIRMRNGTAATFTRRLQEITTAVDPALQLRNILSLDEVLRREQWIIRLEASVFAAVTVSVLLLSAAGIYALMSFTVSQRRKEIAIRTALGADRMSIVVGILSRALRQLAVGAGLGMTSAALPVRSGNRSRSTIRPSLCSVSPLRVFSCRARRWTSRTGHAARDHARIVRRPARAR